MQKSPHRVRTYAGYFEKKEEARLILEELKGRRTDREHKMWYSIEHQCWTVGSYIPNGNGKGG